MMWLASLLRCLRADPQRPRRDRERRPKRLQRRDPRPRLEILDGRILPSTFTVLNLADGGPGSLRQVVLDANTNPGADVIQFTPGLRGTIALTSGQLSIADDLWINGPGAGRLAVSGNDASRVFQINGSISVT